MPAQRLPQALLVSNQANRERLGIARESFPLAFRFELEAQLVAIGDTRNVVTKARLNKSRPGS
jgi:hypothetical protein